MFELANPWLLMLIPLPYLLWYLLPQSQLSGPSALRVPYFDAMRIISQKEQVSSNKHHLLMPFLIWSLLVFALTGPRWVGEPQTVSREGYNIMLTLDLSGSMEITDMAVAGHPTTRLDVVKRAATQFVQDRVGDKIGLILFGTQAYLQTPLTYDRHSVLLRIDDASSGLAGKTTSIGDAIGLAVKRLNNVARQGRIIILLTDGANTSGMIAPLKAAQIAKHEGVKIYTIGLGTDSDPLPDDFAALTSASDLDEKTLKSIAQMTGGQYFRATDLDSLHSVYQTINQLEKVQYEEASIQAQKEYYVWFIALALFLYFYFIIRHFSLVTALRSLLNRKPKS